MKLLIDLLACQTAATRFRGIGRYTFSLTQEMAKQCGTNEMIALADALFPESFEELRQEFIRLLPAGAFLPYYHEPVNHTAGHIEAYTRIAETLVLQAYQTVAPDVVLYPNILEGWGEQGAVALPNSNFPSSSCAAILYDLIPLIYQNEYLQNPELKKVYLSRLSAFNKFDLLLAISDATRRDAIEMLGIKPERVVNISGAASSLFRKLELAEDEKKRYLHRFGISRPFVLYIGGDNFRKNMEGALRAYAKLPQQLIKNYQLVINDAGDETIFRSKARSLGLTDQDIVITGHVADEELVALYNLCKVFVFPSLYEGFGLPVLEAMSCGAPVIASNNSSLPEVVGRSDALFDATRDQEIASALHHVLTDNSFREDLSTYGLERAKQFSWENSARRAWAAIDAIQNERTKNYVVAAHSEQPRVRIAYVSPLPPQKSGISDYSADLLPHLAKHFDIDLFVDPGVDISDPYLRERFSIYPWTELLERRDSYETVVYQYGNSSFHAHMFNLERQFPGVVVLHDFYLSHLVAYIWLPLGSFQNEIDYSHGLRGMIDYQIKNTEILWEWPINWRVLRYARELIVHSKFQNTLLNRYYGRGWRPSPITINQLHISVPEVIDGQRLSARRDLGIEKDKFLFCVFGLVTPLKLIETVVQAYGLAHQELGKNTDIILVGDCSSGEYQWQIMDLVKKLGLENRVLITGYVSKEDYKKYLASANVAIQLRNNSRGETSRAVLDCMTYGLPLIVNAHATLDDYSEEDVIKLHDPVQIRELAQAMIRLQKDESYRLEKGLRARKVIAEQHDPEQMATAYAKVIHRAIQADERKLFAPLLDALNELNYPDNLIKSQAGYAAENLTLRCQPRILVDVSYIATVDFRSGIQRVVRSLVREFFLTDDPSLQLETVRLFEGQLLRASRFAENLFGLRDRSLGQEIPIAIRPGDTLLMLDSSWFIYDQFIPTFERIRQKGGKILTTVYDLLPIRYPEKFDQTMTNGLNKWLRSAISQSDTLVCISRSTADDVAAYIAENKIELARRLDITYIHLGADIPIVPSESKVRETVKKLANHLDAPLFLTVGTLEPRKGHAFILDAFEILWEQGNNYCLCILGKVGWNVEEIALRLRNHPEAGKRLFFIEDPSDAEINLCYSTATALVSASMAEGFGLSIIEAARHKVPVVVSDIPVFREVGGEGAMYFSLETPNNLVKAVKVMAGRTIAERLSLARNVRALTWKESAAWMLDVIEGQRAYIQLSASATKNSLTENTAEPKKKHSYK